MEQKTIQTSELLIKQGGTSAFETKQVEPC